MTTIQITNLDSVSQQIQQRVVQHFIPLALPKVKNDLELLLKDMFIETFSQHPIVEGIYGLFAGDEDKDIQAIFGLTDTQVQEFADDVVNFIKNEIKIDFQNRNELGQFTSKNIFTIVIYTNDFKKRLLDLPSATYFNESRQYNFARKQTVVTNQFDIPWLDWLLNGASTQASIEFDLNEIQSIASRSQRALMIGNDGWQWSGHDFINDIVRDPNFRNKALELFSINIKKDVESLVNIKI